MNSSTKKKNRKPNLNKIEIKIPQDEKVKKVIPVSIEERNRLYERANEKIIFSFNFWDRDNELFNLGSMEKRKVAICAEWFITFIDTLKEISKLTPNELKQEYRNHYDYHHHDWNKVKAKFNFDDNFLSQIDGVQFRLSASKGRVHGFMIGNRFYIVWLDPYHNLNPDDRFGGIKYYEKPETCFEKINRENIKLKKENAELIKMLDEATS